MQKRRRKLPTPRTTRYNGKIRVGFTCMWGEGHPGSIKVARIDEDYVYLKVLLQGQGIGRERRIRYSPITVRVGRPAHVGEVHMSYESVREGHKWMKAYYLPSDSRELVRQVAIVATSIRKGKRNGRATKRVRTSRGKI